MYTNQKRPIHIKRDRVVQIGNLKETPIRERAHSCQNKFKHIKRDLYISKETNKYPKRPEHVKTDQHRSKETNTSQKRPSCADQKIERDP